MLQFERDTQLGKKLRVKAKDYIMVNMMGLHINNNYWQRPFEFLPDRFDTSHPLSRTPTGDKRNTFAWAPFNGGKRICFGKTFAECVLKITISMMTQKFDMKFKDQDRYHKGKLPIKVIG